MTENQRCVRSGKIRFRNFEIESPLDLLRLAAVLWQRCGELAAALLQMVCSISMKRKPDARINAIAGEVKLCEEVLAHCAEEDIRVFRSIYGGAKNPNASAHADTQRCLLACTEVPLAAAEAVVKLEAYAAEMAP